ncbi:reverse transcriptase domain-containing protein, partial [Tanacetum coccineum]
GQRKMKHFQHIHYASKTMTEAQIHYTATEKEMLAVVYVERISKKKTKNKAKTTKPDSERKSKEKTKPKST